MLLTTSISYNSSRKELLGPFTDMYDEHGTLMPFRTLMTRFGLSVMELNSLLTAIPMPIRMSRDKSEESSFPTVGQAYRKLSCDTGELRSKIDAWEKELNMEINTDKYMRGFTDVYRVTNVPKYRSFQYRLLHRAVITNVHLHKWLMAESELCSFCNLEKETYTHLFIFCPKTAELWLYVEELMNNFSPECINFGVDMVLWNRIVCDKPGHIKNFICLVTKQYIYRQRCLGKPLCKYELKHLIYQVKNIEKYIAVKNGRIVQFNKKWTPDTKETRQGPLPEESTEIYVDRYISNM